MTYFCNSLIHQSRAKLDIAMHLWDVNIVNLSYDLTKSIYKLEPVQDIKGFGSASTTKGRPGEKIPVP